MSNVHYGTKWKTTINDLMITMDYENKPRDENEGDLGIKYKRTDIQWFEYYAHLYIRYIDCYKRLEDTYDQLLHPQKRVLLKDLLENTILRMVQVKRNLVYYNTNTVSIRSEFPNIDKVLVDLKMTPNVLDIPVPRYFKEHNFEERDRRNQMIDKLLIQFHDTNLPEEEVIEEKSLLDATLVTAIRIIQKNERGRQGIFRALQAKQIKKKEIQKISKIQDITNGAEFVDDDAEREHSVLTIQTYFRGYKGREQVWVMREAEYEFLGMTKKKEDPNDKESQIYKQNQKRKELKKLQAEQQLNYTQTIDNLKQEYQDLWQDDIKDKMLEERRKWIRLELERNDFKGLPRVAEEFYEKDKVKHPLTPEEIEFEQMLLDQKAKEKKKAKDAKKAGKKKKKKLTDREEFQAERKQMGPTEAVGKIQEKIQQHTEDWAEKKEYENEEQGHDEELVKKMILPEVEKNVQVLVDEIIDIELGNLRLKYKLKKKKAKKKKKKKAKKKKAKKVPGAKSCKNRDPRDMLAELIEAGIIKKLQPASMCDIQGGVNMLRLRQEETIKQDKDYPSQPDPSMLELRNYLTENIIMPMGSQFLKDQLEKSAYFNFFGPHGSGKTLAVRAIASELDAMVVDLSPSNIETKYNDKPSTAKMLYMAFTVAKKYQPSIIYIDEVDEIFKAKKKKKKKKGVAAEAAGPSFARLKKPLQAFKKAKYISKEDRVAVISCTAKPWGVNKKMLKKFTEKRVYFPFPDYGTRKMLFHNFMESRKVEIPPNFPLSTIAHITEGFTAGNYREAIYRVLTERRIMQLKERGLTLSEFIGPLSNQPTTYAQEYVKFREFFDDLSGVKARRAALLAPPEDDKKKPKKTKK